ncbi:MAG: aminotransferase class IV [Candidatus Dormibacteraceae bacterium]
MAEGQAPLPWTVVGEAVVRSEEATLSVHANAVSYGTGVFEGIRAGWNASREELYLLDAHAHFARLRRSAQALGLELQASPDTLVSLSAALLRRNEVRQDAYLRPLLLLSGEELGVRMDGVSTRFSIGAWRLGGDYLAADGVHCLTSTWRRCPDVAMPIRAKVIGSYAGPALAKSEALAGGCGEAIMLNDRGRVSEATTSNVFIRRGRVWSTPAVTEDILEGITRRQVMELIAEDLGEKVVERPIDRSELYTCDEAILCGTAVEVVAILSVDRRGIGAGEPGERTRRLRGSLRAIARREDSRHPEWTAPVWHAQDAEEEGGGR